jgi:uncharacterized protein (DUF1800 family)
MPGMGALGARSAVIRLLWRSGFGATPDAVAAAVAAGFDRTLDAVLAPAGPDAGAAATPPPAFTATRVKKSAGAAARAAARKAAQQDGRRLVLWWLDRMVAAAAPWPEKRTLLWHGHWATSIQKVKLASAMLAQNETMRRLGGGGFDALARAMVVDPALMIWLDASGNTAAAPNENLARELMELFTLGVGHYSENDVRQAARALTGWRVDFSGGTPAATFAARAHATGSQTVLGVTSPFTADGLADLLVSRPDSARYLATRLWGWLVAPVPPSAASLDRAVSAYGAGRDLTALCRALFTDPAFTDPASVLVRQPIEYVVGLLRALRLRPSTLDTKVQRALLAGLTGLGQVPFEPPNVGGWPVGGAWLTTSAARARLVLAEALARAADLSRLSAATAADRPDQLAVQLGVDAWTARTRSVLAGAAGDPVELVTLAASSPEYVCGR